MLLAEEIYRRARKAYDQHDYRDSLSMLDKHWTELERYAKQHGLYEVLVELRQTCRDEVIRRQTGLPPSSPATQRTSRKLSRIKRRRH